VKVRILATVTVASLVLASVIVPSCLASQSASGFSDKLINISLMNRSGNEMYKHPCYFGVKDCMHYIDNEQFTAFITVDTGDKHEPKNYEMKFTDVDYTNENNIRSVINRTPISKCFKELTNIPGRWHCTYSISGIQLHDNHQYVVRVVRTKGNLINENPNFSGTLDFPSLGGNLYKTLSGWASYRNSNHAYANSYASTCATSIIAGGVYYLGKTALQIVSLTPSKVSFVAQGELVLLEWEKKSLETKQPKATAIQLVVGQTLDAAKDPLTKKLALKTETGMRDLAGDSKLVSKWARSAPTGAQRSFIRHGIPFTVSKAASTVITKGATVLAIAQAMDENVSTLREVTEVSKINCTIALTGHA
jgi:hypothetical protein